MNTTQALRHLMKVLRQQDHPDEMQRPTEAEYQLALAQADAALAADGRDGPLQLRDGTAVDRRAPWPLPNQIAA